MWPKDVIAFSIASKCMYSKKACNCYSFLLTQLWLTYNLGNQPDVYLVWHSLSVKKTMSSNEKKALSHREAQEEAKLLMNITTDQDGEDDDMADVSHAVFTLAEVFIVKYV